MTKKPTVCDDPRLLGEVLAQGAYRCFVRRDERHNRYLCEGQELAFDSGGTPFRVTVSLLEDDATEPFFEVEDTGDGLTFTFVSEGRVHGISSLILSHAKRLAEGYRGGA